MTRDVIMNKSGPGGTATMVGLLLAPLFLSCTFSPDTPPMERTDQRPADTGSTSRTDTAVFGAGCFWCVEAIFSELKGVLEVTPGYAGGHMPDPDYKSVCTGSTGHAEVARIVYDPAVITFDALLEVFWQTHDPTTKDRQGNDIGTQYRSAIFHLNDQQRELALRYKERLDAAKAFEGPIVTEVVPLDRFWPAENYHHDYYANNPDQGYCMMVVRPKLEKFRKVFHDKLK